MQTYYVKESETDWLRQANMVATQVKEGNYLIDNSNNNIFKDIIMNKSNESEARILVVDDSGFVIMDSSGADMNNTIMNTTVLSALSNQEKAERIDELPIMIAAAPVLDKETQNVAGAVVLVASIKEILKPIDDMRDQVYLVSLVIALFAGILSFGISSVITKPLKMLMKFVQKVTNGQLDQKVEVTGRDEIAELGNAFNHMTEQLQRVEQSRQEFVSNVSHELKTPLSSIKVLTESLMFQEDVPVEVYKEFFEDINSEVDRLNNIISDLLNLVRLDQKEVPLNISSVSVNDMTQGILKCLAPLAKQKDIKLIYESHKDIVAEIDEVKFNLALTNLVENAIKYTPNGGEVNVILKSDLQDGFIVVSDTGIGIAKEEQSRIFERFYRTDKTRNRQTGGTGLGLAITYKTVVMHNGAIEVQSEEGKGTMFSIQFPLHHIWEGGGQ